MPTIANSNNATKQEIRDVSTSLSRDTASPGNGDVLTWNPDGTDTFVGPHVIHGFEGSGGNTEYTIDNQPTNITGVTVLYASSNTPTGNGTLDYTNATTTLTWAANGESAGAGVDISSGGPFTLNSGTTGSVVVWVVAASLPGSNQTDTDITVSTNTASNPVITMGYNYYSNGVKVDSAIPDPYGIRWQAEGNWHDGSAMTMEGYLEFTDGTTVRRPFFCKFNKDTNLIKQTRITGDGDNGVQIAQDDGTSAGVLTYSLKPNRFELNAADTSQDTTFQIDSASSKTSVFKFGANGDNMATKPTVVFTTAAIGGSSQHRQMSIVMSDDTADKTGKFHIRADSDISGADSVMVTVGQTTSSNLALFHISSENFATNYPTLKVEAKASQTRGILELDGVNNTISTVEARKVQLYPKGYWAYRESGNTSTDREPGTGANSVSIITTNCPGTGTGTKWFPMLDTSGALYWIPGVSDA